MEFVSMGLDRSLGSVPLKFLPSQITGLKLWTRFNSGITVTGAGVSQWDDQSGNGNHLKQGTDTNRPSKEADGSVLFDGADNYLKADAFTLTQPETIYILGKQVTWTIRDSIFDGNLDGYGLLRQEDGGISPELESYAGAVLSTNSDLVVDTYSVIITIFNGVSSVLQIDNNTPLTGDAGVRDMGGFILGARAAVSNYANIQIKEVAIYNTAHDAATRAQVIKYFANVGDLSI